MTAPRPEVLLTMADYHGTLAAVRSLGRAGVPVVVADGHRLAPARFSRHAARVVSCPDVGAEPESFVDWLLWLGTREPGRVLLPTSDDVAWILALHRDALSPHYRMYGPPAESIWMLLDKWRLHRACLALDIATPATWLPRDAEGLEVVRQEARFPVVVKPRTQVFLTPHQKGRVVQRAEELAPLYEDLLHATSHARTLVESAPDVDGPIVQAFADTRADGVYSLSGFIDETGEIFAVEASRKLLQWPPRLGVGTCFEATEVRGDLADAVARLLRHAGYHGAFEVEFVRVDGRYRIIDVNPRFYGQMQLDVARGLDLPRMMYVAALGERRELRRLAGAGRNGARRVYCSRIELEVSLRLLRAAGKLGNGERRRWKQWLESHEGELVDPVIDRDDWAPAAVEAVSAVWRRARHPRSAWREARGVATSPHAAQREERHPS